MGARIRDAAAVVVLVLGGTGAALAWHPLGRWAALAVALGALVVAGVVYRLRPSAFPWRDDAPRPWRDDAPRPPQYSGRSRRRD